MDETADATPVALIHKKIIDIMKDCPAIAKNSTNTTQGYKFRGIEDVTNNIQPLLIKHGVFVVPSVINVERQERTTNKGSALLYSVLTIKYTFYAEDGSSIEAVVVGEGMDSGDKASNKAMAVGMKYALFQVFCIPTNDIPDPDKESHEVAPRRTQTASKAVVKPENDVSSLGEAKRAIGAAKTADEVREVYGRIKSESVKKIIAPICKLRVKELS